jgi:predicted flap endonuclease-1-like 5' DNA nuclease
VEPPEVSLTAETVLATLKVPAKWITKKITDAETRRQVQAMYDELMATGRVEAALPEDDRIVRDLHAKEVLAPRAAALAAQRDTRLAAPQTLPAVRGAAAKPAVLAGAKEPTVKSEPAPVTAVTSPDAAPTRPALVVPGPNQRAGLSSLETAPRCYLLESDDLERAPSIGPKLAERLALGGIVTVKDFLAADTDAILPLLGGGRFDAETVAQWKSEARLVLRVPGLRGTHAQLLAGAGYDTAEKLAAADPVALSAAVLAFATTPAGARVLRNGDTPDMEAITRWVRSAQQALAA